MHTLPIIIRFLVILVVWVSIPTISYNIDDKLFLQGPDWWHSKNLVLLIGSKLVPKGRPVVKVHSAVFIPRSKVIPSLESW